MALVLLLVGLACFAAGAHAERRAAQSRTHLSTRGEIVSAQVRRTGDLWYAHVEFSYRVPPARYLQRESLLLRGDFASEAEAKQALGNLKRGGRVEVYYDPETPERGRLERNRHRLRIFAIAGLLWTVLAALWFCYDRVQSRKERC